MRAILAALMLCVLSWALPSTADAHSLHRYRHAHHYAVRHSHRASAAEQLLGPGLLHMLKSAQARQVALPTAETMGRDAPAVVQLSPHGIRMEPAPIGASFARNMYANLITVETAAGIPITVASDFAPKIEGFIGDLVALGYRPRKIHCAANGGHVRGSLHYQGRACDFDQHGWGKTASVMYHVQSLVSKWGLRDGCEFRDCGHVDAGLNFARRRRYASAK